MTDMIFHPLLSRAELAEGSKKSLKFQGHNLLICHHDNQIFVIENMCSHANEALECGLMRRGWIACPAHGARFDLETGEPLNPPASRPVRTYPVRVQGDMIEIAL